MSLRERKEQRDEGTKKSRWGFLGFVSWGFGFLTLCSVVVIMMNRSVCAQPSPGDVFREYTWYNSSGDAGGALRVGGREGTTDWNTEILEEIVNPTIVAAFEAVPESFVAATDTHRVVEQTRTGDNLRWTWGVDIDTEDEDVPVVEIGRHGDTTRIEVGMATFLAMANAWQQTYGDQSAEDIIAEFGVTFPALPPVPENAR